MVKSDFGGHWDDLAGFSGSIDELVASTTGANGEEGQEPHSRERAVF